MTDRNSTEPVQEPSRVISLDPETFRLLLEKAPTPMLVVQADGRIALANKAAVDLVGFSQTELEGEPVEILLPDDLHDPHVAHRAEYAEDPQDRLMGEHRDLQVSRKDGAVIPVEIGLRPVETSSGPMVVCTLVDLRYRRAVKEDLLKLTATLEARNERLAELATTDSLTSLRNRQAFMDHLETQMETSVRHARPLSVLMLDIDYFKTYNDRFGHLAGDEVLRRLGGVLRDASRRSDLVARLGGEEFGVILPETEVKGAVTFGERFREAVETYEWPLREVTVSVGATTVAFQGPVPRPDPPTISQILREADQALYRSKDLGRNRITHFVELAGATEEEEEGIP